jgi:hypothetical protein
MRTGDLARASKIVRAESTDFHHEGTLLRSITRSHEGQAKIDPED